MEDKSKNHQSETSGEQQVDVFFPDEVKKGVYANNVFIVSVHSTTFCHPAENRPTVTSHFHHEVTPMRKHRTPEQWQALVDQQHDSGLSASKFCKQENIGYASFCNWRKRLSDPSTEETSGSGEAGFLDLSSLMGNSPSSGPGWNIVLSLGNGVELRLSQNG